MTMEKVARLARPLGAHASKYFIAALTLILAVVVLPALGGERGPTVAEEYAASLTARSAIEALNADDMFGDRIGLFTGSVEFVHTDVLIPGNGPEVAVRRRIKAGSRGRLGLGMFGNWDMAIPSMHGLFSTQGGWRNYTVAEPFKRCSKYQPPADETISHNIPTVGGGITLTRTFRAEEFWHGTFLYLPETGEEDLLSAGSAWPTRTGSVTYPLRTKSGSVIRCIPVVNGEGEGFEVITPDGTSYRLDHMATGPALRPLIKSPYDLSNADYPASDYEYVLFRREYFLLPTVVADRFGNTVTYSWDDQIPSQLNRISSSDGRIIDMTWSNGQISEVRSGERKWTYSGNRITLPDQSFWLVGIPVVAQSGTATAPAENVDCMGPGVPGHFFTSTFTHPSGAVATYTFRPTLHGRAWATHSCHSGEPVPGNSYNGSYEMFPAEYYTWSLTAKTINGPGIDELSWTYSYGPNNGCYTANRGSLNCTSNSPTTKWVDVRDPSGVTTRYTYGIHHNVNDGYLLGFSRSGHATQQVYQLESTGAYPQFAGGVAYQRAVFGSKVIPLRERTIEQDGTRYKWRVNSYDGQARPVSVTRSSAPIP